MSESRDSTNWFRYQSLTSPTASSSPGYGPTFTSSAYIPSDPFTPANQDTTDTTSIWSAVDESSAYGIFPSPAMQQYHQSAAAPAFRTLPSQHEDLEDFYTYEEAGQETGHATPTSFPNDPFNLQSFQTGGIQVPPSSTEAEELGYFDPSCSSSSASSAHWNTFPKSGLSPTATAATVTTANTYPPTSPLPFPPPPSSASSSSLQQGTTATYESLTPLPSTSPTPITAYGYPLPDGTYRCAYPNCSSITIFRRACDLRKHYNQHRKHLFCRYEGCPKSVEGGFSSNKDRARHEAKHNPGIPCEWEDCERVFSRVDNMKDHLRRIHLRG